MSKPKKVFHVLGAMHIGGVESWLMNVIKTMDSSIVEHNIIVHNSRDSYFDEDLKNMGIKKIICENNNLILYTFKLYQILKSENVDIVHSHVHTFSGFVLTIAKIAGIKNRIAHIHSDRSQLSRSASIFRRLYNITMQRLIKLTATSCIAVSESAATSLLGDNWYRDRKNKVIYCGINYSLFRKNDEKIDYRELLGLSKNTKVIGHVGRFEKPKNHIYILKTFKKLIDIDQDYCLVLIGDGSLRDKIQGLAESMGIKEKITFLGNRSDVPSLMKNLIDIFIFPSLWEGLPLTLVEAQFSGLPCIVSDSITKECNLGQCEYLPTQDKDIDLWVQSIIRNSHKHYKNDFEDSIFNIKNTNRLLLQEYTTYKPS